MTEAPAWLPTSQLVVSALEDHPPGTLVFPFEPHQASEPTVGVRVDHEENPALVHRLVFALCEWPAYRSVVGELLQTRPGELFVGFRMLEEQRLVLDSDLHAASVEEGGRDPRGGLLRISEAGVYLTGLRHARGYSYGTRPQTLAVDPAAWQALIPTNSFTGIMYRAKWRLRLRLSDREVVTVAEVGGG